MTPAKPLNLQSFIIVTFTLEGFHRYPQAPAPVAFLSERHRHLFNFTLRFRVNHCDRDKEFFLVSREVQQGLENIYGRPAEFGAASCEELARYLLIDYAPSGCCQVEVWEDGENGALVTL